MLAANFRSPHPSQSLAWSSALSTVLVFSHINEPLMQRCRGVGIWWPLTNPSGMTSIGESKPADGVALKGPSWLPRPRRRLPAAAMPISCTCPRARKLGTAPIAAPTPGDACISTELQTLNTPSHTPEEIRGNALFMDISTGAATTKVA